jgi:hypothetical protein
MKVCTMSLNNELRPDGQNSKVCKEVIPGQNNTTIQKHKNIWAQGLAKMKEKQENDMFS